ncbi:MAG: UvrD-helicase domain-containing protein [Thermoguttaceae bacterium]|nr:UvrD-helicase domain-containing protein [Thermoguttaceae bacterium]
MAGLTDQQERAVSLRGVSVGVSAGAGSGKTRVLTERFLAEVKELMETAQGRGESVGAEDVGSILRQLVAITFTQRAARELSQRVRKLCEEEVRRLGEKGRAWIHLWRTIDFARIGTIHSFCGQLLRHHAALAQVDPEFEIIDEGVANVLTAQVVDDVLRQKLSTLDGATIRLATQFGLERLAQILSELVIERSRWFDGQCSFKEGSVLVDRWTGYLERKRREGLRQLLGSGALQTLRDIAAKYPSASPVIQERVANVCQIVNRLEEWSTASGGDPLPAATLLERLQSEATVQGVARKHGLPQDVYELFSANAQHVREECKKLVTLFGVSFATLQNAADLIEQVLFLAREVIEGYEGLKRQEACLDYSDLIREARKVVEQLARSGDLGAQSLAIKLLLVDEFQDTDRDQEALIRSLCGDALRTGKLFFVGDYKQSIYRFRRADPEVFRRLWETIPAHGRVALTRNFRSQPGILSFVNALFCQALGPDYEPLVAHRPQVNVEPIVEFLWAIVKPENGGESGRKPKVSVEELRRAEAERLAQRLRRMFDTQERLVVEEGQGDTAGHLRPVRPGDVVILFRTLSNIDLYERALRKWGIDYYVVGGQAFYAQQEVYDLLHLLRAISDPSDAFSLAGVLRSPFFCCDDEVLWRLGHAPEGFVNAFYGGKLPEGLSRWQEQALTRARQTLGALRERKDSLPVAELIQQALELTGYDALVLTEFLGERKLANLHKLIELARQFDRPNFLGLDAFIARLSDYVARQPVEPLAPLFWETADVVRLMTVHQAKGLEFPVVIVADVARSARGPRDVVYFSDELGPYVRCPSIDSPLGELLSKTEEEENLRELMRVFYVACTRAADYLILSAGLTDSNEAKGPWIELLAQRFCLTSGEFLHHASYPGEIPKVKVVTEPETLKPPSRGGRTLSAGEILDRIQSRRHETPTDGVSLKYLKPVNVDLRARREFSFTLLRHTGLSLVGAGQRKDGPSGFARELPLLSTADEGGDEETKDPVLVELASDEAGPGALVGSFVHEVLSLVNFADPTSVPRCVRAVLPRYEPLPEAVEDLEEIIHRFVASPLGQEIARAKSLLREVEFLLPWPPLAQGAIEKRPYIRGFFDCLYQEPSGGWILVDYKTNRIQAEGVEIAAGWYQLQLEIYGVAAEYALGTPPAAVILYFLRPGRDFRLAWSDEVRKQAVQKIDALLSGYLTGQ